MGSFAQRLTWVAALAAIGLLRPAPVQAQQAPRAAEVPAPQAATPDSPEPEPPAPGPSDPGAPAPEAPEPRAPEAEPPAPAAPAAVPVADDSGMLHSMRRGLRSSSEWLVRGIDGWFGQSEDDAEPRVRRGRVGINVLWREREGFDANLRFDLRARVPNLERRAYVFLGRDDEREIVTDQPEELSRRERLLEQARDDRSFFAGLALPLRRFFEFRVGLRAREKIYAQARYRRVKDLGEAVRVEFRETLFWTLDDRFGSTTSVTYEHALSSTLALRWPSSATISQRSDRLEWTSTPGLHRSFGDLRILSLVTPVSGRSGDGIAVSEYGVQLKWQQPVYRDWLITEFLAGHYWPRNGLLFPREERWAVDVGLRMLF